MFYNLGLNRKILLILPVFDGEFGVGVFFVISGFLITSLLMNEEEKTGTISLRNFYTRRILRIFPAYYFLLLIYFILQIVHFLYIPPLAWATALTYTKYLNYSVEPNTAHAWSLSLEENFYLLWPIIFIRFKRIRRQMTIVQLIIFPIFRSYLVLYAPEWIDHLILLTRMEAIAMGCYFALYKEEWLVKCSPQWNRLFYGCLAAIWIISWVAAWAEKIHRDLIFVPLGVLNGPMANFIIGIVMLYSVYGPKGNWYKVLNSGISNYIGMLSYSLYLWQQLFLFTNYSWMAQAPQNVFFAVGAAMFSYYVIERPFLKLKAIFSAKKVNKA
jgi:peptidoglycan/LPS O-acetylase OafA/YrhL